jgi:hypothetical protein
MLLSPPPPPWPPLIALALALASFATGCSGLAEERCGALCSCVACAETERDACVVEVEAEQDIAEAYGCGELYEAYVDCELTKSRCRDGRFFLDGIDCDAQLADLNECKVRGSSLD